MAEVQVPERINDPAQIAAAFGHLLRGVGIGVPVSRVMSFVEALGRLSLQRREDVYWAGRSTLISDPHDVALFDRTFAVFWERKRASGIEVEVPPVSVTLATDTAGEDGEHPESDENETGPTLRVRYSALELSLIHI